MIWLMHSPRLSEQEQVYHSGHIIYVGWFRDVLPSMDHCRKDIENQGWLHQPCQWFQPTKEENFRGTKNLSYDPALRLSIKDWMLFFKWLLPKRALDCYILDLAPGFGNAMVTAVKMRIPYFAFEPNLNAHIAIYKALESPLGLSTTARTNFWSLWSSPLWWARTIDKVDVTNLGSLCLCGNGPSRAMSPNHPT